jgi:hypothetical protein
LAPEAPFSRAHDRFLEFVAANPEGLDPKAFQAIERRDDFFKYPMHPWPYFLDAGRSRELEAVNLGLARLVREVPRRLLGDDPARFAEHYGILPETARLCAMLIERTDALSGSVGRGDFILSDEGFKCCELNMAGNLGGIGTSVLAETYLGIPLLRRFLDESGYRIEAADQFRILFRHFLDEARRFDLAKDGALNAAFTFEVRPGEDWCAHADRLYRQVLAEEGGGLAGRLEVCADRDLSERRGELFLGDLPLQLVLDTQNGAVGRPLFLALLAGKARAYNGPVSQILSDKLNLALLSEHAGSGVFDADERRLIERHVPWTRRVARGFVDYRGERAYLPDLLLERREEMVLKLGTSMQGTDVHVGRATAPEAWDRHIRAALAGRTWLAQEYVEPLSVPYQYADGGAGPHDVVWGLFVFGERPGGAFLRMQPQGDGGVGGVVNAQRGARLGLVLEVENP